MNTQASKFMTEDVQNFQELMEAWLKNNPNHKINLGKLSDVIITQKLHPNKDAQNLLAYLKAKITKTN